MALELGTELVHLDALKMRVAYAASPDLGMFFRDSLDVRKYQEHTLDKMIYELRACVLAEKLVDKRVEKTAFFSMQRHSSWWQHFKDDVLDRFWLTRWFVRWRPVTFETVESSQTLVADFKQYATFPAADIRTPEGYHKGIVVAKETISWT